MQINKCNKSGESGATYVEMALSIVLFMFIIITVIELLRFGYTIATLQHVLDNSLRASSISNFSEVATDPDCLNKALTANDPVIRASCAEIFIKEQLQKLLSKQIGDWDPSEFVFVKRYPKLSNLSGGFKPPCQLEGGPLYDFKAGNEKEYFSICINYKFDLFMGIKKNILTFGITKNEPFAG